MVSCQLHQPPRKQDCSDLAVLLNYQKKFIKGKVRCRLQSLILCKIFLWNAFCFIWPCSTIQFLLPCRLSLKQSFSFINNMHVEDDSLSNFVLLGVQVWYFHRIYACTFIFTMDSLNEETRQFLWYWSTLYIWNACGPLSAWHTIPNRVSYQSFPIAWATNPPIMPTIVRAL